jgi:MFS family permease
LVDVDSRQAPPRLHQLGNQVWLLSACQFLYYAAISVDLTLTALAGLALAPTPFLATLPLAMITLIATLGAVLAGLLTARLGYRTVLVLGAVAAVVGGALSAAAVVIGSFPLLCVGTGFVGLYRATGGYIRYMAADRAPRNGRERAVSIVLIGGLVAGFVGPVLAVRTSESFATPYLGAYLAVSVLAGLSIPILYIGRFGTVKATNTSSSTPDTPVTITSVRRDPRFILGVTALAVASTAMTLEMAMAPIGSSHAGHSDAQTASIIQWHMIGMFGPSLFSGVLMGKIGKHRTLLIGCSLLFAAAIVGMSGNGFGNFLIALALNGVAWNFLYIAGTSFLVETYPAGGGGRIQALSEGLASGLSVFASLAASALLITLGWETANVPGLAMAVVLLVVVAVLARASAAATRKETVPS